MFYFLRQNLFDVQDIIEIVGHTENTSKYLWTAGTKFKETVPKDTLMLDPNYGTNFPDFFDTSIPVMSKSLINELHKNKIDNFDEYPMTLKRIDTGEEFDNYSAINIIGCVDAVDLEKSNFRLRFGKPYFTGKITIDPLKCMRLKAFRLLNGPGFIVVTQKIAGKLESRGFRALLLQPTIEYTGA